MSPARTKTKHPNRIPFEGLLTRLDQPSDIAPNGSRGHRTVVTKRAAEEALHTLIGMAVGFKAGFDGHGRRQKCGVIDEAWIVGDELRVAGYIYGYDYPEVIAEMKKPNIKMGLSYEIIDARIENMQEPIWKLIGLTFTGAAILLSDQAAYTSSTFNIEAAGEQFTGKLAFENSGTLWPRKRKRFSGRLAFQNGKLKLVRFVKFKIKNVTDYKNMR